MKVKVDHDLDDDRAAKAPDIRIETDEDCQLAQDRLDALNTGAKGKSENQEAVALEKALGRWHARKAAAH